MDGEIILTALVQADGIVKKRPAIILRTMPPFDDVLVCGVSTQLQQLVPGLDEVIGFRDSDFFTSGLRAPSLVRLGFLATLPRREVIGVIGAISAERHVSLLTKLADFLRPHTEPI